MAVHDVSHELRGEHGKWTRGGAALHRLAKEATAGASRAEAGHKAGDRVKYKTGSMGTVHHIDDKGKVHVVWDKGRGKPVATPAHHLTGATSPVAAEKAARDQVAKDYRKEKLAEIGHVPPYKPPRQAGSRGGVPAPTTGPDLGHERFMNEKLADGQWHDPTVSKDKARALATLQSMEASGKVESRISPTTGTKQWRKKSDGGLDPKLLAQVREIQAREKAKMEAENKGRGGVTEYKDVLTTPESAAYLAKLPGGGVQARPFHEVHAEYQAKSQTLQRALDNPGRYGPGVIPANKRQLDQLDAELRKMGARKTGGSTWEMPPKAGTAEHAAEQLKNEMASVREQLHDQHHEAGAPLYTPESLTDARRSDMAAQVRAGQSTIVVKVPSGSEIQMSQATARYLLYGEQPGASIERGTAAQALARSKAKRR